MTDTESYVSTDTRPRLINSAPHSGNHVVNPAPQGEGSARAIIRGPFIKRPHGARSLRIPGIRGGTTRATYRANSSDVTGIGDWRGRNPFNGSTSPSQPSASEPVFAGARNRPDILIPG